MWFKIEDQHIKLNIFAKPNAKKTAFLKIMDNKMYISLHASPSDGKANDELIAYLAKLFGLPKSLIVLHRGKTSRNKQIILPLTEKVQKLIFSFV